MLRNRNRSIYSFKIFAQGLFEPNVMYINHWRPASYYRDAGIRFKLGF